MPCPYNIIFGRETALPCPLYHSDATGFDMKYTRNMMPKCFAPTGDEMNQDSIKDKSNNWP